MAFNWTETYLSGKGSMYDYFVYEEGVPEKPRTVADQVHDLLLPPELTRDQHLMHLMVEWAQMCGLKNDDQVTADFFEAEYVMPDNDPDQEENAVASSYSWPEGWNKGWFILLVQPDDPIYIIYKDGKPKGAYYASFRGVYQAGCVVTDTGKKYFALNFGLSQPHNVWKERDSTCAQEAQDYMNKMTE